MPKKIAIVGLYRSGSSFWAEALHHLGVNMGGPFWENDIPNDPANHYEPAAESVILREMWNEPRALTNWTPEHRQLFLRNYAEKHGPGCGIKHPLLSLMIPDILKAWGDDVVIVWSFRALADSVASLTRTTFPWPRLDMYEVQHTLWRALQRDWPWCDPHVRVMTHGIGIEDRRSSLDAIIKRAGLTPTAAQYDAALACWRK